MQEDSSGRKSRLRLIIPLGLILGGLFLAFYYAGDGSSERAGTIRVSGNIEVTDAEVSFKIAGRVEDRLVTEGDRVTLGQVIAHLESKDLTQQVALQKAQVEQAEAALSELLAGSRPEEITAARAAVEQQKADLERLAADYKRYADLYEQNLVSTQDRDNVKTQYEVAQKKLNQLEAQLKLVVEGPRKEEIAQARARLTQARESLALAQTNLGYAVLRSPLTGVVLSKNIEPGEYVLPGTPVVTVGDLENVWLRAYINETDLGRVKLGQRVKVTTDTYPDKVYGGRISFIASDAEFTPKNVQTEKERVKLVYRIKVDISNPNMELKPGMPADAEILIENANPGNG